MGLIVTKEQKTLLKFLINSTLRITVLVIILGLLPTIIFVWSSPSTVKIILLRLILSCFLLTLLPIVLLRWINPPTSAFMLQTRALLRQSGKNDSINYFWVDYENIAPTMRLAAVAFEDPNFPEHAGFAWGHIIQVWQSNRAGMPLKGASTISQQLTKNLFLWPARTYSRKIVEAYITVLIEVIWSKQRILEIYLNMVQLDKDVFGVGAAAKHFFKKSSGELTVEEAALLAAVLSNPVIYQVGNPSDLVRRRQAWILEKMQELGSDYLNLIN